MSRVRPTHNQMKCLVDLMAHDPQLCSSKFTQSFTHKIAQQRWESIAVQLNSLPGAENDWHEWKKVINFVWCRYLFYNFKYLFLNP